MPTDGLYVWEEFLTEHSGIRPDVIFHDLGHTKERIENMPRVFAMAGPGSVIILDDVHKPPIRRAAQREVMRHGYQYYDLTGYTFDDYGRHAGMTIGV